MTARTKVLLPFLALMTILLTGCPWWLLPPAEKFTSADRGVQSMLANGPLAPMSTGEGVEGEGETVAREVVEPDVIRLAGNLLYVLNQYRGLTVADLDTNAVVAQVPTYGYPRDLYLNGDRAYVLVGCATEHTTEGNTVSFEIRARLYVVDVGIPAEAAIIGTFDLDGDLVDSRLVGDVLYAVSADYEWYWPDGEGVVSTAMLKVKTSESRVTSVNVADPGDIYEADVLAFAGYGDVIQATNQAIFVAASDWQVDTTSITYVDISDPAGAMAIRGSIEVAGYVADRFKIDAYDGVLRVVSSGSWEDPRVYVTTIDLADPDDLTVLGGCELEDAIGETLFATRFDGDVAYIVTFFVVDPLFVVDLADPANPRVTGALEVPGWSTHIEPMGDRLVALGVDDTDGGRRVCVSLFDVSDPPSLSDPAFNGLIDRVTFGEDWAWSSAYSDVKAFTVLDGLLIVPFSGWASESGGYDRLQFVTYDMDDLEARGTVDLSGEILRSLEYDGMYYGVTTEQLATIDATDLDVPEVTNRLTLAEYVADFIELSTDLAAEIIVSYDAGTTIVRTVGLGKRAIAEVPVQIGDLVEAYAYGEGLVLVGNEWGEWNAGAWADSPHYNVALVDCSDPAAPVVGDPVRIDVEPFGGWAWGYDYREKTRGAGIAMDAQTKQAIAPWWIPWAPESNTFLLGNTLVLRCRAEEFDTTVGPEADAYQGLALVDLTDTALSYTTVGLGLERISSLDATAGKLYIGSLEALYPDYALFLWRPPLCAYYIQELDVAGPTLGPAANVPGEFVQYDPANGVLTLLDYQWTEDRDVTVYLRTVAWDGVAPAGLLSDLALSSYVGSVAGAGDKIYVETYEDGYGIEAVSVNANGQLEVGDEVLVTEQWGTLLGAHADSVYLSVGDAIVRYDFSGEPVLADLVEVMGYPLDIRFGAHNAFVCMGYFGIAVLPL